MRSRPAPSPRSGAPEPEQAISPHAGVQSQSREEAPARDPESTPEFSLYGDPLFGMAIATAALFAVLAALMA